MPACHRVVLAVVTGIAVSCASWPFTTSSAAASSQQADPSLSAPPSPFAGLVGAYVKSRTGSIEAALYDLHSGQSWELNPQLRPQATASIVKVDILETLLYQARVEGRNPSSSEKELMTEMVEVSSNSAATSLWDLAGGRRGIGAYNKLAGLTHTVLSSCVQCAGFPWPGWGLSTTTPADQLLLLEQLTHPSDLLTSSAQSYALQLMSNIEPSLRWGVSADVPAGTSVALKTGDVPLSATDVQVNSIGRVDGGGHDYVLAMLTTGDPSLQYGVDTLNEMAKLMWQQWRIDAGDGYWLVTAKGNVYNFGDAGFFGSEATKVLPAPVVAMTAG